MKLDAKNFRSLDEQQFSYSLRIRANKLSPLLLIKSNGAVEYAVNLTDKDNLVANFDEKKDVLVWAWAGEWKTDMFKLSKQDLDKHYR